MEAAGVNPPSTRAGASFMKVEPKFSTETKPYQWVGCVTLNPEELEEIINALPPGSKWRRELRKAWDNAAQRAYQLNQIDQEGAL